MRSPTTALDEDRVVGAFDLGQRVFERDHRRVDPGLDAARMALRVCDELDRVAELTRISEVHRLDRFDALAIDVVRPNLDLVSDRSEDRELVGGVEAAHVIGGVGLRKAGDLRLANSVGQ
jgi:hypothetical protein